MRVHLEQLPVEVQMSILCDLGTIDVVLTLLRASPRFLYVYRTNRSVIYAEIASRHIPWSALPAAIGALNLRNQGTAAAILTFTKASSTIIDRSKLSLVDWRYLHQTHCIVEGMIYDSVKRAFSIVQRDSASALDGSFDMLLSPTEYTRLLRGFYNWEILTAIGSRYFSGTSLAGELDAPSKLSDLEQHLERFRLFCKALVPHEFEEMYFVAYYLRTRVYEFLDKAEDDRYEIWETSGPYKYRYDFVEHEPTIWTDSGREYQDMWVGNTLYSTSLTAISHIVHESKARERMRRVEAINTDRESPYRTRWKILEGKLDYQRTLAVTNLISPLLPPGWHSGCLPKIDWAGLEFADSIESCNLGLLWGCRSPRRGERPDIELLEGTSIWGAALWDAERLRKMDVLMKWPGEIADKEHRALSRHRMFEDDHPRRNECSIQDRVHDLESRWIAEGKMLDEHDWKHRCDRFGNSIYAYNDDDNYDYDSDFDDDEHYSSYDDHGHGYGPDNHSNQS